MSGGTGSVRAGAQEPVPEGGGEAPEDVRAPVGFDAFFTAHRPALLARAVMLCGSRQDAEDAVQDAFLAALENWDRISLYEQPNAWVSLVMRRKLWRALRLRLKIKRAALNVAQPRQALPEETEQARRVLTAMAALPPRQRMVLVMYGLYAMTHQEIADDLGIAASTARGNLRKGRDNLRRMLGLDPDTDPLGEVNLVGTGGPAPGDRLAAALSATESWLCSAFEEDEQAPRRARAGLAERQRKGTGRG
ncbi:RNA polymerase sigma factor [Streptomyces antarcticus]|uniref:RNA polymerase sigma factor n=1 Tax=Streptomyces antarcticus TaxID=2996458 RepID=UPI00226DD71A|nr:MULTISPECIES: sigma-70 family RNA polymerase sigma factor [unclassified Streptomyces]MCY0944941.1 sigma-70 family RNA polymerase sigma factor [Streptomyces sp. H34-AA3]MCZ4082113.1 sigma-70 family RNA polymerase sigma factor [Streptomyces sp. H34-S5]